MIIDANGNGSILFQSLDPSDNSLYTFTQDDSGVFVPVTNLTVGNSTSNGIILLQSPLGSIQLSSNNINLIAVNAAAMIANVIGLSSTQLQITINGSTSPANNILLGNGSFMNFQPLSGLPPLIGAFAAINVQVFKSSGTYTPNTSLLYAWMRGVGGGGAGGGGNGTGTSTGIGGGGGSGGYSESLYPASTLLGNNQTITIGSGGTGSAGTGSSGSNSSVGSLLLAIGGSGAGPFTAGSAVPVGGAGGAAGTGNIIASPGMPGQAGNYNTNSTSQYNQNGNGGSSLLGAGANSPGASTAAGNAAANNTGGGGSGASINVSASNVAGGNGGSGLIIIIEFLS